MAEEKNDQVIDMRDIGATGLRRFSGFIFEEFLHELTGWKGVAIFKEMSTNEPTVVAMLFAIDMLCRGVPWRVKPASDQPFDLEAADFLRTCMDDMSQTWIDTISEIFTFLKYGYSVHEIVYKRRCGKSPDPSLRSKFSDGRIGWRKFPIRSQDTIYRWQFDDHGGIQGVQQLAPPHYYNVLIPIEKLLLFRTTIEKNNPEGRSILRGGYRPWYIKKNLENIEGIGMERDLAGLPVALVPPDLLSSNASPNQKALLAKIQDIVTNIRRDEQEGIVFPSSYDASGKLLFELKLLSTGGQRQFDTDKIITRYDNRILMTCLADFIMLGQNNVGSWALASSKTNLFTRAIGSYMDIVSEIFNRFAIPRLMDMNDFQMSDYPKIMHGDCENVDLKDLGDYIYKLASSGAPLFPNPELEKYLMQVASLPEPADLMKDQEMLIQPRPTNKPGKVTEIPASSVQVPTGVISDTTPVNGQPKTVSANTDILGVDHIKAMSDANQKMRGMV